MREWGTIVKIVKRAEYGVQRGGARFRRRDVGVYYKVIQITFNANDARAQLCVPCVTLCELCGEIV